MQIPTKVHGVIDYLYGIALIAAPFIMRFTDGPKQWVLAGMGIALIVMSLLTDYEVSAVRVIPMPVHLGLDVIAGIFLAVAPWMLGFADVVSWTYVVLGAILVALAALTSSRPEYGVQQSQHKPYASRNQRR